MSKKMILFAVLVSVMSSSCSTFALDAAVKSVPSVAKTDDALPAVQSEITVFNPSFEVVVKDQSFPDGWTVEIGGGAKATVVLDKTTAHSGSNSAKITNKSPLQSYVFASFLSSWVDVQSNTTYTASFYAKGKNANICYIAVIFDNGGERRLLLPGGDFDWRKIDCQFTTPRQCKKVTFRFASDDVTKGLWIDDISLKRSEVQLADIKEPSCPKNFDGFFPRISEPLPEQLVVCSLSDHYGSSPKENSIGFTVACLQGIVNRTKPRIYLFNNRKGAEYYDEAWLAYIQSKGYTGSEEVVSDPKELINRFRKEITGVIIYDTELPGSLHAARMLAGLKNALPVSPKTLDDLKDLNLPVVMDLRGKWKRNVDAYEFIYENYWDQMNHHVLNWMYPMTVHHSINDYLVAFNVFSFWVSGHDDNETGADPVAEEQFLNKLLASTPGNVPVTGWPNYSDHTGVQEYTAMRWVSEYGKFFPGTEFSSNLTVHTAIRPDKSVFQQKFRKKPSGVKLEKDKIYIAVDIIDSGDGVWYHQFHQRKIWADPIRGTVPTGFCLNPQVYDLTPVVAQWYYENATPNEELFSFIYMNSETYATRFCQKDQDRILAEFASLTGDYCRKMDMKGIEVYNG
ncbi:MAG: GxGYxYP domain-containing protein, partial [Planctomycetota bacterium]